MYTIHEFERLLIKSGTYSGEFKVNAVKYMHSNILPSKEASARLGCDHQRNFEPPLQD
jgi:hypothetical protein